MNTRVPQGELFSLTRVPHARRTASAGTRVREVGTSIIQNLEQHRQDLLKLTTNRTLSPLSDVQIQFNNLLEELRTLANKFQSETINSVRTATAKL